MGQRQASRAGDAAVLVPENTPSGPKPLPACPGPQVQVQVLILLPSPSAERGSLKHGNRPHAARGHAAQNGFSRLWEEA